MSSHVIDLTVPSVTFGHLLEMRRRFDALFQLNSSHCTLYAESKHVVLEVVDTTSMFLFVLDVKEYTRHPHSCTKLKPLSIRMEVWQQVVEQLKDWKTKRSNNKKGSVQLRVEWGEDLYRVGLVSGGSKQYTYVAVPYEKMETTKRLYETNPILEPSRYPSRLTLFCPLQFEWMVKEACVFGEVLKVQWNVNEVQLYTEGTQNRWSNIGYTVPYGPLVTKEDSGLLRPTTSSPEFRVPLRMLRIITRFCSLADRLLFYLMRPVVLVGKKNQTIRWALRVL